MKIYFLVLFVVVSGVSLYAQTREYVCMPCGSSCDNTIHGNPGRCPSCHMKLVEKSALQFENLSLDEFCQRIGANPRAVLLDVRSEAEFNGSAFMRSTYGYFKNAINIPIDELEARLSELAGYKDREILVYCSHSIRSPRAAMLLNENGFGTVKNLAGGVSTFTAQDEPQLANFFVKH